MHGHSSGLCIMYNLYLSYVLYTWMSEVKGRWTLNDFGISMYDLQGAGRISHENKAWYKWTTV